MSRMQPNKKRLPKGLKKAAEKIIKEQIEGKRKCLENGLVNQEICNDCIFFCVCRFFGKPSERVEQ